MPKKPEPKIKIADIDADGVYQGIKEIAEKDLQPHHVRLDGGCDLPPGKYRWDAVEQTFKPLHLPDSGGEIGPEALSAIAIGFASMHVSGMPLPSYTTDWLDAFFKSFDFKGVIVAGHPDLEIVKQYMNRKKG